MARRGRCRCGSILKFKRGPEGYKTRCPSCGSVVRLRTGSARAAAKKGRTVAGKRGAKTDPIPAPASDLPTSALPVSQAGPKAARMVACEVCRTIVPIQAERCSACGSDLARTAPAPALARELGLSSSEAPVPKVFSYSLIIGWLAASAALIVIATLVLVLSLRH